MKSNILSAIKWILSELSTIRKQLEFVKPESSIITIEWISWKDAMAFFEYKDTQMADMVVENNLIVAKIGRRKFIKRSSILELLERSIVSQNGQN